MDIDINKIEAAVRKAAGSGSTAVLFRKRQDNTDQCILFPEIVIDQIYMQILNGRLARKHHTQESITRNKLRGIADRKDGT